MLVRKLFLIISLVFLITAPLTYSCRDIGTVVLRPLDSDMNVLSSLSTDRGFQEVRGNLKEYSIYLADPKTVLGDARKGELHLEIRSQKFELVIELDTKIYTTMRNAASDGYKYPEFSDRYNHGDEFHDNARRIKETAPIIQNYS